MAISPNDIKVFLTGIPDTGLNYSGCCVQDNPNQSLGGFTSSTEINGSTLISANITDVDTVIQVDDVSKLPGASTLNPAYAVIGNEIISYTARSSSLGPAMLLNVTRGLFGRISSDHLASDVITGLTNQNLFDNIRASENASGIDEYRCFSVMNTNTADTAHDVRLYLSPVQEKGFVSTAVSDGGFGATMTNTNLIGVYVDDFFDGGVLTITGGAAENVVPSLNNYLITKWDTSTGKATIDGNWTAGTPNGTTTYIMSSLHTTPSPDTEIDFAIERHEYADLGSTSGVATTGGTNFLIDEDLPLEGWVKSSDFIGAYMLLLTGDGVDGVPRRITAYNPVTGKVTVDSAFVNEGVSLGDLYTIIQGPSAFFAPNDQVPPPIGTGNFTNFVKPVTPETAISININGIGEDLIHNELFYVWVRRRVSANDNSYSNDNAIPNIIFET